MQTKSAFKSVPAAHHNTGITRADIFAIGLLAAAAFFPFLLYFTSGLSFFTFHALSGLMALKHQIAHVFLSGHYPVWNSFILCGAPFHSGIGILDPFLLSYFIFDGIPALIASSYLALLTAGVGMHFYLRRIWNASIASSLAGGIFYLANPFFAATSHESPFMNPPVFLPLIFLFFQLGQQNYRLGYFLVSGFFLALTFLSGNLESFCFVTLFFSGVILSLAVQRAWLDRSFQPFRHCLKALGMTALAAFCFGAIDLLPTLEMIFYSGRNANANFLQTFTHFAIVAAVSVLVTTLPFLKKHPAPRWSGFMIGVIFFLLFSIQRTPAGAFTLNTNIFFPNPQMLFLNGQEAFLLLQQGTQVTAQALQTFFEKRFIFYIQPPHWLFTLPTLCLFLFIWIKTQRPEMKLLGLYMVMLALFAYTPVPNLNARMLHLNQIAYPRLMFSFFFIQSVFIAYGLTSLENQGERGERFHLSPRVLRISLLITLTAFAAYTILLLAPFNLQRFQAIVSSRGSFLQLSAALESLRFFVTQNFWVYCFGASKYLALIALLRMLQKPRPLLSAFFVLFLSFDVLAAWNFYTFQKRDVRMVTSPSPETEMLASLDKKERIGTRNDPSVTIFNFYDFEHPVELSGNLPLFWNQRTMEGATLNLSPAPFKRFWELQPENTYTPTILNAAYSRIYDLMGMRYLFSTSASEDLPYLKIVQFPHYSLYENPQSLPRFYFAKNIISASDEQIAEAVQKGNWNPAELTLVDAAVPADFNSAPRSTIEGTQDSFHEVRLKTSLAHEAFLATTDAFHPRWKVRVDGKAQPLVRTNLYFKGVFLPPGEYEVSFIYEQPLVLVGGLFSLIAVLTLIVSTVKPIRL